MRVLLVNPPYRECVPPSTFPSGFGYIASVLRKGGHDVQVLDINGHRHSREKVEQLVREADFGLAASGGLITRYEYIKWLAGLMKKYHPKKFSVVGGALATSAPELVIEKMPVDGIVLGEAEYTMLELANALEKKADLKAVKGLWFKKSGKVVKNEPRPLLKNLDELPFPAWDLFPMEQYLKYPSYRNVSPKLKSISVSTVRGCPYNCSFCYNIFGKRTGRTRSVESVIAEIKELQKRYGVKVFSLQDDLFTINRRRVMEFCSRLIEEKLDILWGATARVNLVDLQMLRRMKQAGCMAITFGIESGSQKMLDTMNKQATVEQAKNAIRAAKQAGLYVYTTYMVGTPGETAETVGETVDFIKDVDLIVECIFITNPYPGSELYDYAKKKGLIKDEEAFVKKCGEALDLNVNLTEMSDEELLRQRAWAMHEVISSYRKRHPLKAVQMDVQKIAVTVKNFGVLGTAKKAVGRIRRLGKA